MNLKAHWRAVDRDTHWVTCDGVRWTLVATPDSKYPWLLSSPEGVTQEIGPPDIHAARAMAELWLNINTLYSAGQRLREIA